MSSEVFGGSGEVLVLTQGWCYYQKVVRQAKQRPPCWLARLRSMDVQGKGLKGF